MTLRTYFQTTTHRRHCDRGTGFGETSRRLLVASSPNDFAARHFQYGARANRDPARAGPVRLGSHG
jgi:hypothetical protein